MLSPEYSFNRPHEPYTPVDKPGASSTGLPPPEDSQQSFSENQFSTPQHPLENPTTDLTLPEERLPDGQDDGSSVGLLAQGVSDFAKKLAIPQDEVFSENQDVPVSSNHTKVIKAMRAMWQETGSIPPIAGGQDRKRKKKDRPLDPLTEDRNLLPKHEARVYGKIGVDLRRDLSPNAKKLLDCLVEERGDVELLPMFAKEDNFDLDVALTEMRALGLLDESDPKRIRLVSRKLK